MARPRKQTEIPTDIDSLLASFEKDFGVGIVQRMGDTPIQHFDVIDSGSLNLNSALGIGGYPFGRIIEIYGPESSGKTTTTLHAIAECQKAGYTAAFVDAEHALDVRYASGLGVNVADLLISQPDNGEQALEIVDRLVRSGAVKLVVVDSVAALVPKAELEGEMGDTHVGLQARLMSQAMRKLAGTVSKSQAVVIFINQTRQKIGVMFGSPTTTSGGNALKFYATIRLQINRIGSLKQGEDNIGNRTKVRVTKNKCAPPFKEVEFDILFGKGISRAAEALDLAVDSGLVDKSGAWFAYNGVKIGQGRPNAIAYLEEYSDVLNDIVSKLKVITGEVPDAETENE